jgi:chromosome segregation ATPase
MEHGEKQEGKLNHLKRQGEHGMEQERRYIEEVGEAVEKLGIMLEQELGRINQGLVELYRMVAKIKEEGTDLGEKVQTFKDQMDETKKLLQGFDNKLSKLEFKLAGTQKDPEDENSLEEIRADLLAIKSEFQFARSDLKELLKRQDDLEGILRDRLKEI